ncbi:MAG: hypothetical protein HY908_14610 [Myxococcales bacterium]|nr:hypothetical protein [Myxococcales bacterium]
MVSFSPRERYAPCEACGAVVSLPVQGGQAQCGRCRAVVAVPPRPETSVTRSAPTLEQSRRGTLRAQDGRPLLPPAGLEALVSGSDIAGHKLEEARLIWNGTRRQLASQPADVAAAERLVWLTMILSNTLTKSGDFASQRALFEAALEVLMLPRHRQTMRGYLARIAARHEDFDGAEAWLAGCDPGSEDLQSDSSYRISRAMIDTGRRRPQAVLEVLGGTFEEVPIMDAMDATATVLRANGWEKLGHPDRAQQVLSQFMNARRGTATVIESIVGAMPPGWQVCAQSIAGARQVVRQETGARAAAGGGGAIIGYIVLVTGCIPLFVLAGLAASGMFQVQLLFMLIFPVVFGGMGLRMILAARRAREIATHGIQGRGRVVNVSMTGTRINHVPVMRIDVQIEVPGHPPTVAATKRLMPQHVAGSLMGRELGVIWHPKYPADVVLDI